MESSRFKKMTKNFNFAGTADKNELPAYARQYVKREKILTVYRTTRDFGIFTDKKVVLFDNEGKKKQIHTIPYNSLKMLSVYFDDDYAELDLYLSDIPINLRFINMSPNDKLNLRVLYTCIDKIISGQEPIPQDIEGLENKTLHL